MTEGPQNKWKPGAPGSDSLPDFTVIVAAPPGKKNPTVLGHLRKVHYPLEKIQVLLALGNLPPLQRNTAAQRARGEILFFLDDDSLPSPDLFLEAASRFQDPRVDAVGGPSLSHPAQSFWQKCFTQALTSPFGGFGIGARYAAKGSFRPATEKELILCNFAIRRKVYLQSGGLDERLYPNEENEFCNRLKKAGKGLFYDPDLVVYRFQRKSLGKFAKQMFRYGRGRMEHFVLKPSYFSPAYLVPFLFLAYLVFLAGWTAFSLLKAGNPLQGLRGLLLFAPLALYSALNLAFSAAFALKQGKKALPALPAMALTFLVLHICYGAGTFFGFLRGLVLRIQDARGKEGPGKRVEVVPFTIPEAATPRMEPVLAGSRRKKGGA